MTETASTRERLPELLSLKELSEWLGVPANTLHYWRVSGRGPKGFRLGKQLRYRVDDVLEWIREQEELSSR